MIPPPLEVFRKIIRFGSRKVEKQIQSSLYLWSMPSLTSQRSMLTHISLSIGSKKFLHLKAFTHIWVVRSLLQFSKCLDICCSTQQQDVWISIVHSALPMSNFFRSWQNCFHNYNRPLLVLFFLQCVCHTSWPVILIGICHLVIVAVVSNWFKLMRLMDFLSLPTTTVLDTKIYRSKFWVKVTPPKGPKPKNSFFCFGCNCWAASSASLRPSRYCTAEWPWLQFQETL